MSKFSTTSAFLPSGKPLLTGPLTRLLASCAILAFEVATFFSPLTIVAKPSAISPSPLLELSKLSKIPPSTFPSTVVMVSSAYSSTGSATSVAVSSGNRMLVISTSMLLNSSFPSRVFQSTRLFAAASSRMSVQDTPAKWRICWSF